MHASRRLSALAVVALSTVIAPAAQLHAQQLPGMMVRPSDVTPRRSLGPSTLGINEMRPGEIPVETHTMRPPGVSAQDPFRARPVSAKALALGVIEQAATAVVAPGALLFVNTTSSVLNLEYEKEGAWTPFTLAAYTSQQIECAACGAQIKLRFHDAAAVQTLAFDTGERVALMWQPALGRYQALRLATAKDQIASLP